jgi:hypothetical protein
VSPWEAVARKTALPRGMYRVVVTYSGGDVGTSDFKDAESAKTYANDVASEWSEEPQLAYVFDDAFRMVHEGKPYYLK